MCKLRYDANISHHNSTCWEASIWSQMLKFLHQRHPLYPGERNCQTQSLSSGGVVWGCGATEGQPSGYKITESWESWVEVRALREENKKYKTRSGASAMTSSHPQIRPQGAALSEMCLNAHCRVEFMCADLRFGFLMTDLNWVLVRVDIKLVSDATPENNIILNFQFPIWCLTFGQFPVKLTDVQLSQTDSIIHWKIHSSFRRNYYCLD